MGNFGLEDKKRIPIEGKSRITFAGIFFCICKACNMKKTGYEQGST